MLAVLDAACHVMLYSGPTKIGKLHVGGVSAEFSASPYITRIPNILKSLPRRSSLLPNANQPIPKFDEHLLSPVHPAKDARINLLSSTLIEQFKELNNLVGLRDPVADRITLEYSDSSLYRITLPALASSTLVDSCLSALRQSLQRDVAMTLLCKWYATRNAPGPVDPSPEQEFQIFINLLLGEELVDFYLTFLIFCILLGLLGYDVERLNNSAERAATPDEAKKQRPSPKGSSADWEYILQSEAHQTYSRSLSGLLNLTNTDVPNQDHTANGQVNINAELFPYIKLVLFTLHLLYEEMKLDSTLTSELKLLVKLLYQISSDLRLQDYVIHYWKDFPDLFNLNVNNENSQFSLNDISKVQSSILPNIPLDIMKHFYDLITKKDCQPYPYIKNVNPLSKNYVQIVGLIINGCPDNNRIEVDQFIKVSEIKLSILHIVMIHLTSNFFITGNCASWYQNGTPNKPRDIS